MVRLLIDPWPPDFESAMQLDSFDEPSSPEVDSTVELVHWEPITPAGQMPLRNIYFVDGVRRIEARVITEHENSLVYGLLGSVGVGATCCEERRAWCEEITINRFAILGAGLRQTETV